MTTPVEQAPQQGEATRLGADPLPKVGALSPFKHRLYKAFMLSIRAYQRLFLDMHVWGREHIPPGPKLYVMNHFSSTDGFWPLPVLPDYVHFILGPAYKYRWLGRVLDAFQQISAMPNMRRHVVDQAAGFLSQGDCVLIAPEGDIQAPFELGRFFPGVARIYRKARVPIVPIALASPKRATREWGRGMVVECRVYRTVTVLRGPYCVSIGEPFKPAVCETMSDKELDELITAEIKARIQTQLDQIRSDRYWCDPSGTRFHSGWLAARRGRVR